MTRTVRIVDLRADDEQTIRQIAAMLVAGFREHWPKAWPDLSSALAEVRDSLDPERISRVALDEDGTVLGWIGGIPEYDGHVWELHPIIVAPALQGQGIGRALVSDLEDRARERGGLTLRAGSDDEDGQTSLAGVDIYDKLLERLATIRNLNRHPYEFYLRVGFSIVGVVPDANGYGKPDIILAKRLAKGT